MQQQHAFLLSSAPSLRVQDVPELLRLYKELVLQYTALAMAVTHRHASQHMAVAPAVDAAAVSHGSQSSAAASQSNSVLAQQQQHQQALSGLPADSNHRTSSPADPARTKLPHRASSPTKQQQQQPKSPQHRQSPLSKATMHEASKPQLDNDSSSSARAAAPTGSASPFNETMPAAASGLLPALDDLQPLQPEVLQPGQAGTAAASEAGLADLNASAQPMSFTESATGHDGVNSRARMSEDNDASLAAPAADLTSNPAGKPAIGNEAGGSSQEGKASELQVLSGSQAENDSTSGTESSQAQPGPRAEASDEGLFSGLSMAAQDHNTR